MRSVLLTGGTGYIGSHTCKMLRTKGFTPVVLDNLVYGHEFFAQWRPFVRSDIGFGSLLTNVFKAFEPGAVIHFTDYADNPDAMAGRWIRG